MASATASSFSFQPWIRSDADEGSLKDILARVNLERGHFRDITETSLQEELATEGALELSESESEDGEEVEEEATESVKLKPKPATREELFKAKHEMLASVRAAEQEVLMSLDFVSLLLSKDAPKQGQSTMSPALRGLAPLGSLGTDIWQRMAIDKAREAQDDLLATNTRIEGLQQSADDLLSAATRLQTNVRRETQYWDQILSISEEGWNVCRIPGQQHRLGVSFGFSESEPTFRNRGIAELNASSGGNIMLERAINNRPKGLRVVLRKNGNIVGLSQLPKLPDPEETTLEARIRYARDSLFDEELYHEMIRESRTITSLGVSMKGSAIELSVNSSPEPATQVSMDLLALDEDHEFIQEPSAEQGNALANAIVLAARLLLSQAHRDRTRKRAETPLPLSDKTREERPTLPILRPILSFLLHRMATDRVNAYVETIGSILGQASIEHSYAVATLGLPSTGDVTNAESLTALLMQPWVSEASLSIMDPESTVATLNIRIQTTLAYGFGSLFTLSTLPGDPDYRFERIDELVDAADSSLISILAKALVKIMGTPWKCNESEGVLTKDTAIDEKSESLWIDLASDERTLALSSLARTISWKPDVEGPGTTFWEAKTDLLGTTISE